MATSRRQLLGVIYRFQRGTFPRCAAPRRGPNPFRSRVRRCCGAKRCTNDQTSPLCRQPWRHARVPCTPLKRQSLQRARGAAQCRSAPARFGAARPPRCTAMAAPRQAASSPGDPLRPRRMPSALGWICGWQCLWQRSATQPARRGTTASVHPRQRSPRRASHGPRRPPGRRKVCVMMHSCREVGILHPRAGCSACLDAPAPHPSEIITYPCLSSSHTMTNALRPPREVN